MSRPVNVELVFLRSVALAVSAAAIVLSNAEQSRWPAAVTPFIAAVTYMCVDRRQWLSLSVRSANALGLIAFSAAVYEFWGSDLLGKLLAGAHLLVYMSWVVLLLPKGFRQFWWLIALSVLQISVASVLTNGTSFGASLIAMLFVMIWLLSVFTLYRAQKRLAATTDGVEDSLEAIESATPHQQQLQVRNGLQADSEERWIGWRFTGIVGFSSFASLLLGAIAFAVFPRVWVSGNVLATMRSDSIGLTHQTGFTKNVQLGEIGQIMQSDSRVLQFDVFRMSDNSPVTPREFADEMGMDEILFRGTTLGRYRDGEWEDGFRSSRLLKYQTRQGGADFRVKITQDAPIQSVAFSPLPIINARHLEGQGSIQQQYASYCMTHSIPNQRARAESLEYEVWCTTPHSSENHGPGDSSGMRRGAFDFLFAPKAGVLQQLAESHYLDPALEQLLPRVAELTQTVITNGDTSESDRERVQRIVDYLAHSGRFQYSLNAKIQDASIDPIEDFLFNRKVGHCEYFASACALMLQMADVPARVVNGYKGSEINAVSGRAEVMQKHAHTWTEAFVNGRWETLDATPAAGRRNTMATSRSRMDWWSDLRRTISDHWQNAVQKMSMARQEAMLRGMLLQLKSAAATVRKQGLWQALKMFYHEVLSKPETWINFQAWFITFGVLLAIVLLARSRFGKWVKGLPGRLNGWFRKRNRQQRSVVRFYENFRTICARHGLKFREHHTAQENAAQAAAHFAPLLISPDDRQLPARIAAAFNRVRFGNDPLATEAVDQIRGDVSRLAQLVVSQRRLSGKTPRGPSTANGKKPSHTAEAEKSE